MKPVRFYIVSFVLQGDCFQMIKIIPMRTIILFVSLIVSQCIIAQTPEELKSKLPVISGWTIDKTVEVFDPDNLFERINGAAEGYLLYDFKELTVFVYNKNGDQDTYVTIQIYRHATPADAFGVYAAERPTESNFAQIGVEGYQEGPMLNFFVDCLYVKIESPSSSDDVVKVVRQIADNLSRKINSKATFPAVLQSFPAENKLQHSEQYVPKSFLGHEFLYDAFTAEYQVSGKKYQVFIIDAGTAADAKTMLTKYYQFTKQTVQLNEGRQSVKDRYNGDIECQWKGRYIWGIVNDNNAPINVDNVLKAVEKKL